MDKPTSAQSSTKGEILPELNSALSNSEIVSALEAQAALLKEQLSPEVRSILENWNSKKTSYQGDEYTYKVRNKTISVSNYVESLSHTRVPKISLPRFSDWGEVVRWVLTENVPGEFPYTAGVYPFKRTNEDPTRMFAGEGSPERNSNRFHYLSSGMPAARLSTACDSVTRYGEDPQYRPDV